MNQHLTRARELATADYVVDISEDGAAAPEARFFATNPELPGCMAQGATFAEALSNLEDARVDYIRSLLDDGLDVPSPAQSVTSALEHINYAEEYNGSPEGSSRDARPVRISPSVISATVA